MELPCCGWQLPEEWKDLSSQQLTAIGSGLAVVTAGALYFAFKQCVGRLPEASHDRADREKLTEAAQRAWTILLRRQNVAVDVTNEDHVELLQSLWAGLQPNTPSPPVPSQKWTEIGFQGKDPQTDFRAMGLLGLHILEDIARNHAHVMTRLLHRDQRDVKYHYSAAIAGLSIAHGVLTLLRERPSLANALFPGRGEGAITRLSAIVAMEWDAFDKGFVASIDRFIAAGNPPELAVMQFEVFKKDFFAQAGSRWHRRLHNPGEDSRLEMEKFGIDAVWSN